MKELLQMKVPPHNIEAEQSTLGAMLIERDAIAKAIEIVKPEDFYRENHQIIFEVICLLFERGEPVDIITLTEELRKRNKLESVGGVDYITALIDSVPTASNVEYYSFIVEENSLKRKLINVGNQIANLGYYGEKKADQLIDEAEKFVFSIAQKRYHHYFIPLKELMKETFNRLDELYSRKSQIIGVPTGFIELDKLTAGLQPSDLIVIAARPGMGKSSLVLNIARHVALKENIPVAIFSLEMARDQLAQRLLCAEAGIDFQRLRTGFLKDEDWKRIIRAIGLLSEAPLFVDDTPGISVLEMRSKARRLKAEKGLGLLIVDYLQLIKSSERWENRVQEISEIARSLKNLAKELKVPVVALSQLSREVEKRQDKRPLLSDLRESGAIEQEADVVVFIYREDYYSKENMDSIGNAEIIVAKQRNGPVGNIELLFLKEYAKFVCPEKYRSYS